MLRRRVQVVITTRPENRYVSSGADQPVRARRTCNVSGAKGLGQATLSHLQLETGGNLWIQ